MSIRRDHQLRELDTFVVRGLVMACLVSMVRSASSARYDIGSKQPSQMVNMHFKSDSVSAGTSRPPCSLIDRFSLLLWAKHSLVSTGWCLD